MTARFEPQLSVLPEAQQRLWRALAPAPRLGYVLYGGTAIALRLGHRQSVDLEFLLATKTKVILQRVEAKDYRDIAALLAAGVALDRALAIAQAMYGNQFQPSESLKALTYFEGGDLELLTEVERNTLIRAASAVRQLPKVSVVSRKLTG